MSVAEVVRKTRSEAVLFDMAHRGLLEVRGEDRVRWLDGMISGDVQALEKSGTGAGCYATLLTNRGAIVADLHVARFDTAFLLESLRSEIPRIREILERYVIADDVILEDRSDQHAVLGLEGPRAPALIARATADGVEAPPSECWAESEITGRSVLIASFGFSGEPAVQLRMKPEDRKPIEAALDALAPRGGLLRGSLDTLEILRVEAGIPALGAELDEEVLPPEARLERAVSTSKGCYVGQEIVARLRARGQVNHLLVGFRLEGASPPPLGTAVSVGDRVTGEFTSIVRSPSQGLIALGYVRREHAEPDTLVEFAGGRARVASLPFVAASGAADSGVT